MIYLFTDVSVEPKLKFGFGAYLLVSEIALEKLSLDVAKHWVKTKQFELTSSTRLELETLLWALEDSGYHSMKHKLTVYTDSQNIVTLPGRRQKLEFQNFQSKKSSAELNNAALYRDFYSALDRFSLDIIKVAGHTRLNEKDYVLSLFSCVDKACRKALRDYLKHNNIKTC